jgi:hypothetical protein
MKERLSGQGLCDGILPEEFANFIDYTRSLRFEDKPDYANLRRVFRRLFAAKGFKHDNVFDWTQKMFDEMQSKAAPAVPSIQEPPGSAPKPKSHGETPAREASASKSKEADRESAPGGSE